MSDTKQRILDTALTLFSQKGVSAVSLREICGAVSIKESSVYYHFPNKQAIFDQLLTDFAEAANTKMAQLAQAVAGPWAPVGQDFYRPVCDAFFEGYLMDPFCNKVLRLLSIERAHSPTMAAQYDHWMFVLPLSFQQRVFDGLLERKAVRPGDSAHLALSYYAPIYLLAQRWLLAGPLTEERKAAFRQAACQHTALFFQERMGDAP